ncbi:MAG TPA: class I adenylate-forming enzyme family protein [Xanthobacteraceae bacterium]|nr:class I adenylate-forming enzyme family protein [Xanthobacteraceae bacterium]
MAGVEAPSLRAYVANAPAARFIWDRAAAARFTDLDRGTSLNRQTSLGGRLADLAGRSVLLATASQLTTALALIELDGCARRLVILPPDIEADHLGAVIAVAGIDAIVTDDGSQQHAAFELPVRVSCASPMVPLEERAPVAFRTEWLLLTSGTTGTPKMVVHDLAGLTAAMTHRSAADGAAIWGTFYDIRRYGGLQIFLRTVVGGASLVLSSAGEPVADHLARLARHGVTHLLGTPTHWRRALMIPAIRKIAPRYVRLSGEIADQAILDALRAVFPQAAIVHAYASTEAGVAFAVNDGLAGFPAAFAETIRDGVEMKIVDGSLRIRSPGMASRYVGTGQTLADADGFVDTGDIVERRGDRYYFAGRKGGIINIGGLKVHPEEIEAVINRHPQVRMSLVRPKQSPITGSIAVADVVLKSQVEGLNSGQIELRDDILKLCREALPRHKVPAAIRFVPSLAVAATGKLARRQG